MPHQSADSVREPGAYLEIQACSINTVHSRGPALSRPEIWSVHTRATALVSKRLSFRLSVLRGVLTPTHASCLAATHPIGQRIPASASLQASGGHDATKCPAIFVCRLHGRSSRMVAAATRIPPYADPETAHAFRVKPGRKSADVATRTTEVAIAVSIHVRGSISKSDYPKPA